MASALKITYWGVTGTFCAPLLPEVVSAKLVGAIQLLVEKDRLSQLRAGPDLQTQIETLIETEVPFWLRSSYGGNTTCVEIQTPDTLLIIDCGSGFRELGVALDRRWAEQGESAQRSAQVLLTHAHLDHTFATPYFSPYYDPRNAFQIWGPQITLDSLTAVLDPKSKLSQIYFPPTYSEMKGIRGFNPIECGAEWMFGQTRVSTLALNHPGGSMAYRLEHEGKAFVFATDHEAKSVTDEGLAQFARGADVLYAEGQYTEAEYAGEVGIAGDRPGSRRGWGHTPVEWCISTALAAGVRELHLGHRDPRRNDRQIAEFADYARGILQAELAKLNRAQGACTTLVPWEGMQIEL